MSDGTGLERTRLVIRGVRSELQLEDGRMRLSKDAPAPSEIHFEVTQIRGTSLDAPSPIGRGWLHIAVVGGSPTPAGELAAMADPYTLPITSRSAAAAKRLARLVDKHLRERGLPSEAVLTNTAPPGGRYSTGVSLAAAPSAPTVPNTPPPEERGTAGPQEFVAELRQLAELHAAGALTDEEFGRAKARILG